MAKQNDTCIVATLLRGKTYIYKGHRFDYNVPVIVEDEEIAEAIAELGIDVIDRDGELLTKPRFDVDFEASRSAFEAHQREQEEKERANNPLRRKRLQTAEKPIKRFRAQGDDKQVRSKKTISDEKPDPKEKAGIKKRLKPVRKAS